MRFKNVWRGLVAVVERLIRPSRRPRVKHAIARSGPDPEAINNTLPIDEVVVEVNTADSSYAVITHEQKQPSDMVIPEELDALDRAIDTQEESSPITDYVLFDVAEIPNLQERAISEVAPVQIETDEGGDSPLLSTEDISPLHEDVEIDIEMEETVPDQSSGGIQLESPHWESSPQTTEREESAEPPPSESFRAVLSEDVAALPKTPTHRRPKPVVMPSFDFSQHARIPKQELREFLHLAELGALDSVPGLTARRIDALLMEALREVDLIGELPISKAAFNQITDVMRREFYVSRRLSIRRVWPAPRVYTTR